MKYDATAETVAGEQYATVQAARPASEALALRHASAVRAVLHAAKAWARSCRAESPSVDLEAKMLWAANQLAKIEKEVSRG